MLKYAALLIAASAFSAAASEWKVEPLDAALYTNLMAESGARAPEGLPDGLVATAKNDTTKGDIRAAWYVGPTRRYGHGILGDAIEAAALRVELVDGAQLTYDLPQNMVFEDRTPRIADLDGDGRNEVITIRSSTSEGGGVAIYAAVEGRLAEVAANDFIGLRNRWLNIAAIADITGDGRKDVAYVRTPHIGGMLRLFRYDDGLTLTSEIDGFSNHAIGSREQRLSAVADIDGDWDMEIAVPSDSRATMRIIDYRDGLVEVASIRLPARVEGPVLAEGSGAKARFIVRLRDGSVIALSR
jgi:hypothetical protein